jgi:hypothetical protein
MGNHLTLEEMAAKMARIRSAQPLLDSNDMDAQREKNRMTSAKLRLSNKKNLSSTGRAAEDSSSLVLLGI